MKIVNFQSGLGNQFFYYLMYLYLRKKHPGEAIYGYYNPKYLKKHNGLELDQILDIELPSHTHISDTVAYLCRVFSRIFKALKAEDNTFSESAFYYDGWWQNKKYFLDNLSALKYKDLQLDDVNQRYINAMMSTNSISIHVRRGDYLDPANVKIYGGICTSEYYQHSINIVESKVNNPSFFIFSNDIEWAKKHFQMPNTHFISNNSGKNSFLDMYLMSHCKVNIIANSSFSYWAAMLNVHADSFVLYPKIWNNLETPDIFPDEWMGL